MKTDGTKTVEDLQKLIDKLITKYEDTVFSRDACLEELKKNKLELASAKNKITEQSKLIGHLELKSAFSPGCNDDKRARLRIKKIIKEIDRCLSLLND